MTHITRPGLRISMLIGGLIYAYAAAIEHEWAQQFVRNVQQQPLWTWVGLGSVVSLLLGLLYYMFRQVSRTGHREAERGLVPIWIATAALLVSAQWTLMSVDTEAVHFLQYSILSIILFLALRRVSLTLALTTVIGIADEAYQYWGLYGGWGIYFDNNDVLLNILGSGLGLVFLVTVMPSLFHDERRDTWGMRSADLLLLAVLSVAYLIGVATRTIALHPQHDMSHVLLLLNRTAPTGSIWMHAWWSGKEFLQISPTVGLILTTILITFYRTAVPLLRLRDLS